MVAVKQIELNCKSGTKSISPRQPASQTCKMDVSKSLEGYYWYILDLARIQVSRSALLSDELEEEINDLVQATLIAFWPKLMSQKVQIASPKAYISSIVRTVIVHKLVK